MELDETRSVLNQFVRERFGVPENDPDFNNQVDLFSYGYIDSFGAVDLTAFIEKRFEIQFNDSDWVANPLNTIDELASFIAARRNGAR